MIPKALARLLPFLEMLTVRKATPADAHAAAEVLRASIVELCRADHRGDGETLGKWLANKAPKNLARWMEDADRFCTVACGEAIVGFGLIHCTGRLALLYVAPGATGRGVGRSLYGALEARARAWGAGSVTLESTAAARGFYERLGFRAAGPAEPGCGVSLRYPYEKALA